MVDIALPRNGSMSAGSIPVECISIMISTCFKGNNMYTVEYQNHEDTVKEIHRTSLYLLSGLIVFATVLYFIH